MMQLKGEEIIRNKSSDERMMIIMMILADAPLSL